VNIGDMIDCVVLNVNPTERRISLGLKRLNRTRGSACTRIIRSIPPWKAGCANLTDFGLYRN